MLICLDFLIDEQTAQNMESLLNPIINGNPPTSTSDGSIGCHSAIVDEQAQESQEQQQQSPQQHQQQQNEQFP